MFNKYKCLGLQHLLWGAVLWQRYGTTNIRVLTQFLIFFSRRKQRNLLSSPCNNFVDEDEPCPHLLLTTVVEPSSWNPNNPVLPARCVKAIFSTLILHSEQMTTGWWLWLCPPNYTLLIFISRRKVLLQHRKMGHPRTNPNRCSMQISLTEYSLWI